ncbi:hypothetical protein ACFLZN_02395 [Nanoarchaeota archaeon]
MKQVLRFCYRILIYFLDNTFNWRHSKKMIMKTTTVDEEIKTTRGKLFRIYGLIATAKRIEEVVLPRTISDLEKSYNPFKKMYLKGKIRSLEEKLQAYEDKRPSLLTAMYKLMQLENDLAEQL